MYVRSTARPIESDSPTLDWAVALAGSGDTVRAADGLCHTLDRLNRLTPASRTLTVFAAHSELDVAERLEGRSDHTFHQPSQRDTGVAIFVALAMIKRWTPNALVTIAP